MQLPPVAQDLVKSAALAHLVTINADGSPQVSCVWTGLDGDDIVFASLGARQKLANLERDPRVAISWETDSTNATGLTEYLVVYGRGQVEPGGGSALLQRLAETYLGPGVRFPPMDHPPEGYVARITVERVSGVGPWA